MVAPMAPEKQAYLAEIQAKPAAFTSGGLLIDFEAIQKGNFNDSRRQELETEVDNIGNMVMDGDTDQQPLPAAVGKVPSTLVKPKQQGGKSRVHTKKKMI